LDKWKKLRDRIWDLGKGSGAMVALLEIAGGSRTKGGKLVPRVYIVKMERGGGIP
jgi:hypothetical protein